MADATWEQAVTSQTVDDAGTATTVVTFTDTSSGDVETLTLTLTADRRLSVLASGIQLADYRALSDR